jgi:hypothetical protein
MSGVDEVSVALERPRRDVPSVAKTGDFSDDDVIMDMTPLEQLTARQSRNRTDIPFSSLSIRCKKDLHHRVVAMLQINESLTAIDATREVAAKFRVSIEPLDRHLIGISIRIRVKAKHQFRNINLNVSLEKAMPRDNNLPRVNNRKGRARNKRKLNDGVH